MGMPPPTRPYIAAVLLLGMFVGTSPVDAQQPAATRGPDLARIRRQLATTPSESVLLGPVRADYVVRVQEEPTDLDYHFGWLYDKTTVTPGYVRPWYPIYHYEMQSIMIPIEHRAHLYPIGSPAGSNPIGAIKDAFTKRKQRQAKSQVEAEVEALKKRQ